MTHVPPLATPLDNDMELCCGTLEILRFCWTICRHCVARLAARTAFLQPAIRPQSKASLTLRTCTRVNVRGRMSLQLHAIMLNCADTAWYCAILRAVAAKITQHHAQIDLCVRGRACTCVAASVSAVIEINVLDARACTRAM